MFHEIMGSHASYTCGCLLHWLLEFERTTKQYHAFKILHGDADVTSEKDNLAPKAVFTDCRKHNLGKNAAFTATGIAK